MAEVTSLSLLRCATFSSRESCAVILKSFFLIHSQVGGGAALDALARAAEWQRALAAWWPFFGSWAGLLSCSPASPASPSLLKAPRSLPFEYRAPHCVSQMAGCVGALLRTCAAEVNRGNTCGVLSCVLVNELACSCQSAIVRTASSSERFAPSASAQVKPISRFRMHPGPGREGTSDRFVGRGPAHVKAAKFQVLWLALPGLRAMPDQAQRAGLGTWCFES